MSMLEEDFQEETFRQILIITASTGCTSIASRFAGSSLSRSVAHTVFTDLLTVLKPDLFGSHFNPPATRRVVYRR